jgi:hypothetical protein
VRQRRRSTVAVLLAAALLGGCGGRPVSEAVESVGPAATATPASSAPSQPPPTEAATATPSRPAGPIEIPDKPADVTFEEVVREPAGPGRFDVTYRIGWAAPEGVVDRYTVVGVTECLREERRFDGRPCLVRGMRIPRRVQERIATAPGDATSVDVTWEETEAGGRPYASILVRASNAAGDSIFTIAWTADVCVGCTG